MRIALFDLDNTLLAGDSDVEWPRFLIGKGILDAESTARENDRFFEHYKAGTLDIQAFLAFQLSPLGRFKRAELDELHREYMRNHIVPLITDKARALVKQHQDAGDLVLIITATNRFVTGPIAREFGIEHLIATEPEIIDGEYTGKPTGIPCFQAGKITRLQHWLEERGEKLTDFEESWFYSDSRNDLPLLEQVTHPVAVDPDDTLRTHAEAHGWPVISLRN